MTGTDPRTRDWIWQWAAWVGAGLLVAWASGRLGTEVVPDSPSYLDYSFGSADAVARSIRTPGYPVWLWLIRSTLGLAFVPAAQVVLHASAVFWMCRELRRWEMAPIGVLAVGLSVAIGCTPTDHINTVASDAPTASIGVMLVAALMRWVWITRGPNAGGQRGARKSRRTGAGVIPVVLLAIVAIMFRPAYLFVIPWLIVAAGLLSRMCGAAWLPAIRAGFLAMIPVLVFLLGWMSFRYWAVGDFGILPFGHQNLAGVLVQLVSDDELRELDDDSIPIAGEIADKRRALMERGDVFADGKPGATMTIELRWHEMTYLVVVPASEQVIGSDPIAQHDAIANLNREIVLRYPLRYAVWLAKAVRRGAWGIAANIVMHPVFLLGIVIGWAVVCYRAIRPRRHRWTVSNPPVMRALTVITATYLIAKLGFVVFSSPAIGRFADAAAIFLPGWLAAVFLNLWGISLTRNGRRTISDESVVSTR